MSGLDAAEGEMLRQSRRAGDMFLLLLLDIIPPETTPAMGNMHADVVAGTVSTCYKYHAAP
jgi:hypothetical protein